MCRSQLSGTPRHHTINGYHLYPGVSEKLIDRLGYPLPYRLHQNLRIDACWDEQRAAGGEPRTENRNRSLVLCVTWIKEADEYIGVNCYCRHSDRRSSR